MASNETSSTKASKLMSFLDKIETEIEEDTASIIAGCVPETVGGIDNINLNTKYPPSTNQHNIPSRSTNGNTVFEGIKSKMVRLKDDLKSKTERIESLESAVQSSSERERALRQKADDSERDRRRLLDQEKEFEIVRNRQLALMERLVSDKEGLSAKVSSLSESVTAMRSKYECKIKKLQIEHKRECRRSKEEWTASEAVRREQWISMKTKQIKSMTIKGLEPEIQRLIEQNKRDIQCKEEEFSELLRAEKEALRSSHEETLDDLRSKWDDERSAEMDRVRKEHFAEIEAARQCKERELREAADRHHAERDEVARRNDSLSEETMAKITGLHQTEMAKLKQLHLAQIENVEERHEIEQRKRSEAMGSTPCGAG